MPTGDNAALDESLLLRGAPAAAIMNFDELARREIGLRFSRAGWTNHATRERPPVTREA